MTVPRFPVERDGGQDGRQGRRDATHGDRGPVSPVGAGAFELADLIRTGALSPLDVCEAYIRRIDALNPVLNALVVDRFDAAREEALAAEKLLASGAPVPPLLGVPFTVKEMIDVAGMPSTFGSLARLDRVAPTDAAVVARLRAAGAIPLGVTNVPEWGFWFETVNPVYGRTVNPWAVERTCGGSSGGEAALVAAGGTAFGIGSDIGGSVRIPAAFCGVFAHKPTHGLLPLTGHYPVYAEGPDVALPKRAPYLTIGPLSRSAADLLPLLQLMAGPDGVDPNTEPWKVADAEPVDWRRVRVLLLDDPEIRLAANVSDELAGAVRDASSRLEQRGAVVRPVPRDVFRDAAFLWAAVLEESRSAPLAELAGVNGPVRPLREALKLVAGRSAYSLPLLMFCAGERMSGASVDRTRRLLARAARLTHRLASLLDGDTLLLMPVHPRVAPRHRAPLLHPFDFAYTAALNIPRVPVTVAPLGLGREGLPLALQIAAARGRDALTIAAAAAVAVDMPVAEPPAARRPRTS